LVVSCLAPFLLWPALALVGLAPAAPVVMTDARLGRVLATEALLGLVWVPILRRRGWSASSVSRPAALSDALYGAGLFAAAYVVYTPMYWVLALTAPELAGVAIAGAPSWGMVVAVSLLNPVAEEFLYLGFVANVLKREGTGLALGGCVVARALIHLYQGPIGVAASVAFGLMFGLYYLQNQRIWPAVFAHGLADALALAHLASAGA
jgi:membrane protease YdiL (CAAX protease family)